MEKQGFKNPQPFRTEILEVPEMDLARVHGAILREKDEPKDGHEPIPIWLMMFFLALAFWSGGYLCFYSGGFRGDVFSETMVTWGIPPAGKIAQADPVALGKRLFIANCAACHQPTGLGQPGTYPPLAGSEWVVGPPNRLAAIVINGLQGPVTVKGATFNNIMPTWGPQLKDAQIAAILSYVRQEWGNKAPPIHPEGIAAARAQHAKRTTPITMAELQAMPPSDLPGPPATTPVPVAPPAAAPVKTIPPAAPSAPSVPKRG